MDDSRDRPASFLDSPALRGLVRYALLITVVIVGAWVLYFSGVTLLTPYPIEYREGASQVITQLLLDGRNPFALENQPQGMTNYGILYSLLAWPFAAAFGNTLLVHRAISLVFILLASWLVFRTALVAKRDAGLAIAGAELVAIGLAARAGLGALPGSLGAFLFLLAIVVPFNRGFDRWGLLVSGLASLLAFYTKPYYLLAFGIVATYLFLCVSQRRALLYVLGFGAAAGATVLLVRFAFPLYFFDTVFSNLGQAGVNNAGHLYLQLRQLGAEFYLSLIAAAVVILGGWPRRRERSTDTDSASAPRLPVPDRALISGSVDYFAYAFVCSMLVFIMILGPNPGSYMNYSYQLILPPFFLWLIRKINLRRRVALLVLPLLLLNLILFCWVRLGPALLSETTESRPAWDELYASVDDCHRILNSPVIVSEMLRLGMRPIDSGQTQYYYATEGYRGMRLFGPSYEVIARNGERYLGAIRSLAAGQEFDCIILTRHSDWTLNLPLRDRYRLTQTVNIAMPQVEQKWRLDIWLPVRDWQTAPIP